MTHLDTENQILLVLRAATRAGKAAHRTIGEARDAIATETGSDPGWRPVASAMLRLERDGHVYIAEDRDAATGNQPAYALTSAGIGAATRARRQLEDQDQATQETAHAAS